MTHILALDFGGTKLSAAITQDQKSWLAHKRVYSKPEATAQDDIETMLTLARELMLAVGERVTAVGVSFGGPVHNGTVLLSHHVAGWENTPLQQLLADALGVPVRVDNDANVGALGEYRFGAGRGATSLIYLTVSTGVGGGIVHQGRIWSGHGGLAGEIGHMTIDPDGPRCLCGKRGCVERFASGPYMAQDYTSETGETIDGKQLAERAQAGDKVAQTLLRRGAWSIGVGIGNAANLLNVERFVLGGGVTKAGAVWWQTVQEVAVQVALPEVTFTIVPAHFTDDAPLWGAVALVEKR